jgi:hypothetical protein
MVAKSIVIAELVRLFQWFEHAIQYVFLIISVLNSKS